MNAATVPLSEYLTTSYSPDCDYVDGEVLERNMGEWDHSRLQALLSAYLLNREKQWGIMVVPEQRVQVKPTRFRVPDILALLGGPPGVQIIDQPPFLCVEILSPEDRITRMQKKINDYLEFGVQFIWVIDPKSREAFIYTRDAVTEVTDGVLRTSNPDIAVPFSELE